MSAVTFGSVCSGIEAASVAWNPLGWKAAWLAEIEPFPCTLLAHHYPDVPNLGDMTKIAHLVRDGFVPAPDVFTGGTPCQAFSVAGLRNSLDDARGNLSLTFCEIANEIDARRKSTGLLPAVIVWENVPGVLSTKDNAFGCFLAGLAGEDDPLVPSGDKWTDAGCVFGPERTVAWRVLDAQYFGLAQRRRRVLVVASARDGFDPAAVLFEFDGVRRDSAPRRQPGQDTAGTLASRTGGGGFPGSDEACSGYVQPVVYAPAISHCLNAGGMGRIDYETESMIVAPAPTVCVTGDITHTLKAEGFDASEDGTGRGQPIVATPVLSFHVDAQVDQMRFDEHTAASLTCSQKAGIFSSMAVRRLTPRECERLQGFPDDYTLIPLPDRRSAKTGDRRAAPRMAADGPRYKALGNSWAVTKFAWLGARIDRAMQA
jgi:DNA (cytosine-5)-methyltransferase 1